MRILQKIYHRSSAELKKNNKKIREQRFINSIKIKSSKSKIKKNISNIWILIKFDYNYE